MVKSKSYTVKLRRYREGKTDYKSRLRLLLSEKCRLVVRRSNYQTYVQIVEYSNKGDNILLNVNSNSLKKYGWKYNPRNIPSSYLTGFLIGLKLKKKKIDDVVLDIGLRSSIQGSVIYSVLKGVVDAGIKIPHNEKILPKEERITGKHISDYSQNFKEGSQQFSKYLKENANPKDIVKNFKETKEKILKENG